MRFDVRTLNTEKPITSRFFCVYVGRRAALLLGILWAAASYAGDATDREPLQLSEAIRMTLDSHPDLAVFSHQRDNVAGRVAQVGVGERARVELYVEDALGSGEFESLDNAQSTLSIAWVLDGQLVDARVRRAKISASAINVEQEIKVLDLAAQTARLFIENMVLQERLEVAKLAEQQASNAVAIISQRVAAGRTSTVEALQAEAQLAQRELDTQKFEQQLSVSQYQLAAQWNGSPRDYQTDGDLFHEFAVGSFDEQIEKLKQSPALQALANQQRIAQSEIELTRIESTPRWALSAGVRRVERSDDYGLVAGLSVPLGRDKGSSGRIRSLRAEQSESLAKAEALSNRLDAQLYGLLKNIHYSRQKIETLQQQVIPKLEEAQSEAANAYAVGQLGYVQWHSIREQWLSARQSLLSALEALHLQHIELQRLTGTSLAL